MSGLPPTVPNTNKVKVRNKTNSFKRPFSSEGIDMAKKDQKALFFNLRKGSSNSKLNEDVDINNFENNSNQNIINEGKVVTRFKGRNFNSDDDDYDSPNEETSVIKMDKLFDDYNKVIKNPALIGYLLKYLISHNFEYNGLLFYLVVQHYKVNVQLKEFIKDAPRLSNEIITTFILEKSILKIDYEIDTSTMLKHLKSNNDLLNIFNKCSDDVFEHCIKDRIDRIRQSIKHGLFTLEVSVEKFNFDNQMNFFNDCIKFVLKILEDKLSYGSNTIGTKDIKEKEQYMSDIIVAVKTSLATIFCYFVKKDKDDNADNISLLSNRHPRPSFLGKSTENLQMISNCILEKHPMFCSKMNKKSSTHSFFKKGKSAKGHNFQEKIFEYPMECLYCEKLLWGVNPQGFYCSHCLDAVHKNCKDFVRSNCHKEIKRQSPNSPNIPPPIEHDIIKISVTEESDNTTDEKDIHNNKISFENENNNRVKMDQSTGKCMSSSFPGKLNSVSAANGEDKFSLNQDTESIDSVSDRQFNTKSDGEFKIFGHYEERKYLSPRYIPPGHVKNIASKYDQKSIPRSQSDENIENKSVTRSSRGGSDLVFLQDLISDTTAWNNDPDMDVEETFEANKELESFPNHVKKEADKAEYTRLLVLMEFHHKIKFTIMTLKRFDYLLIKQWPKDENILFSTLSLNRIIPLYELIKTLQVTIEQCKNDTSYTSDIAQNVINWFVENDEHNLQEWLKCSIDLCCTNSLNLVKNTWKEYYRMDSRFSKVLNKRHNKMIIVEQLANMRPLLFNMPLIVSKIFKDLNKFNKFKEETKTWKEISEKFKKLPTFIDEHCMPLVQLINNGVIVNGLDRSNWLARLNINDPCYDYILDFPKTAFHPKLFDFQEIKISNFRESGSKNKTPAIFVKEISDAYAICYENMLVLLQKENDKYHLKQFKATDTPKLNPILMLENVHPSKGENKGVFFELTLVFINVAVLTQILFIKKDAWMRWHDHIYKMKLKTLKNKTEPTENNANKYSDMKVKFQEFSASHEAFFKEEIKLGEFDEKKLLFQNPNDSREFFVGTSFDTLNILSTCYENLLAPFNDSVLDDIFTLLSNIEKRLSYYKCSQIKDVLYTDDILCEISERQKDEFLDISQQITPPESPLLHLKDDSEMEYDFQSPIFCQNDDIIEITENEENVDAPNKEKYFLCFVNDYIKEIIEEAQFQLMTQ